MRRFALLALLTTLAAAALGSSGRADTAAKAPRLAPLGLVAETTRGATPPKQGVDFSGTNVQEEGVDEPDMVKTDGNTLYAVGNGRLNAVDVRTPTPRLLDTLQLDARLSHELLLHGDRLLVLS